MKGVGAVVGWSALGAAPALVTGACVERALDDGFLQGDLGRGLLWLAPIALAGLVASVAARRLSPRIGSCVEPWRDGLVRRVVTDRLHVATGDRPTGDARDHATVARVLGQTDAARDVGATLLGDACQVLMTFAATVIGLVALDPAVAAVVVVPAVLAVVAIAALVPALSTRTTAALAADEAVADAVATACSARRDIVAGGAEGMVRARLDALLTAQAAAARRVARAIGGRTVIGSLGGHGPVLLLLATAPSLLATGRLTVGGLVGALTYVATSLQPTLHLAIDTVSVSLVRLRALRRRLRPVTLDGPAIAASVAEGVETGRSLATHGIWFRHGIGAQPIVEDFDLHLVSGEHVAVVGASGVGKSTLMDLLVGLTRPDRGHVTLGGIRLDELPSDHVRRTIALVPQEAYVFAGSVRENLTYLSDACTDEQVWSAVEATGLTAIVDRLGGLDSTIDGAGALSAGERQLVVITRVLLSGAAIVVLDEGTCHMDPAAEARAEHALRAAGVTLVVVAHRMSAAQRADRIVVLDGERTWVGTHRELVASCSAYAALAGRWVA